MKICALSCLVLIVATLQASQINVEAAALDSLKDAAKTVAKSAADKAESVEEVKQEGGVVQTALHTTANLAIDKGLDVLATKYPIVKVAAPHIKKFSKPVLNAAHTKINNIFKKDEKKDEDEEVKEGDKVEEKKVEEKKDEEKKVEEKKVEEKADENEVANADEEEKPKLMDKIKKAVGIEKKEDDEEKQPEAEEKVVNNKKRKSAKESDEPPAKNAKRD